MKQRFFNLVPPLMILAVILFWMFGPEALLKQPWTVIVTSALITVTVLFLEWVHVDQGADVVPVPADDRCLQGEAAGTVWFYNKLERCPGTGLDTKR